MKKKQIIVQDTIISMKHQDFKGVEFDGFKTTITAVILSIKKIEK